MSRVNEIQRAISGLSGGEYQKMMDAYFYRKFNLKNIQTLGSRTGSNKVTKGIPDTYSLCDDGTYILIMYGSVTERPFDKIKGDILSCFNKDKLDISESKIKKIICAYTSTNLRIEQISKLKELIPSVKIELIGIDTVSHDLRYKYVSIANEYLNVSPDTEQIFNVGDFIERYNRNKINTPLKFELKYRSEELSNVEESINQSAVTLISGNAGVGKTRLAIEVCKKFERDGYNVLCIANNGQELIDDIRFYTSTPGKYLFFIDDANMTTSLDFIFNRVQNPIEDTSIKLLMTVRDYAKNSLVGEIGKYFDLKNHEIMLDRFKEEEIRDIVRLNLNITDSEILDGICSLAKGNIRAALMASLSVVEQHKIPDDILKSYYNFIIKAQKLNDNDLISLFVIALLPNISISKDDFAKEILNNFQISTTEFEKICESLNQKEIVDVYMNQLVKINDQSFGDYLLRYILVDKKRISIKKILEYGFPKYLTRINYALSTLFSMFSSQESREYIKSQVNESWIESDETTQEIYMKNFYQLNPGKTLEIINKRINDLGSTRIDVSKLDFEGKDRDQTIDNEYIRMLGNFKDTPYYEEAVELLCKIFNEKQDLTLDVYLAFTYEMKFDTHSYKDDYLRENNLINWLWKYLVTENGTNRKNGIYFYVMIVKKFLFVEFQDVKSSYNTRSVGIYTICITYSEGSKKLRAFIWSTLCTIFKGNESLKKQIYHIMMTSFSTVVNKENGNLISIFEWDLKCLSDNFFVKWNNPNLEQAIVMYKLVSRSKKRNIEYNRVIDTYKTNLDFKIYEVFSQRCIGKDYKEKEVDKHKSVKAMIENYNSEQFGHLFSVMKKIEKFDNNLSRYEIATALSWVFRLELENSDFYVKVVRKYFQKGIPYEADVRDEVIDGIIRNADICLGLKLVENNDLENKNAWVCGFFERSPIPFDKEIFFKYVKSQDDEKIPLIPRINELEKNIKVDTSFLEELSNLILNSDSSVLMVDSLFRNIDSDEEISKLLSIFENDRELLKKLYILDDKPNFDYRGTLLINLIINDVDYWNQYLMNNEKLIENDLFMELFKKIWTFPNYKEYIDSFYDYFFNITRNYVAAEWVNKKLFLSSNNANINKKKINWIEGYIKSNFTDIGAMNNIFQTVYYCFPNEKIRLLLDFIKLSNDIKSFERIRLFSDSSSWTGSEVPLIDDKISFIRDLKDSIKGLDYVEHKRYLENMEKYFLKRKKETQLKERKAEFIY